MSNQIKLSAESMRRVRLLEKEIGKLNDAKDKLKNKISDLEDKIELVRLSESPFVPGDVIVWESGNRLRRGKIISIRTHYREDYEYRCYVLNKKGQTIGYATVRSDRLPTLERLMDKEAK